MTRDEALKDALAAALVILVKLANAPTWQEAWLLRYEALDLLGELRDDET